MQPVKVARDSNNADVIILISTLSDLCGKANVLPTAGAAFGVVDLNCMLTQHTFAHEFGHLLGAGHDAGNKSPNGAQPYAHGLLWANFSYFTPGPPIVQYFYCAHSVMSYSWDIEAPSPNSPCITDSVVAYFTSPLITFQLKAGAGAGYNVTEVEGSATAADNSRMLNESAPAVAQNHNTKISQNATVGYKMVLEPAAMSLHVGDNAGFSFSTYNSVGVEVGNPPGTTQVWTSADPTIVWMDPYGVGVRALAVGTTHITLSDPLVTVPSVSAIVTVSPAPVLTSLTVSPTAPTVQIGANSALTLTGTDQYGSAMLLTGITTWTSANPSVATVDSNGTVVGVAVGSTSIIAANSGVSVATPLTVRARIGTNPPRCGRACSGTLPAPTRATL